MSDLFRDFVSIINSTELNKVIFRPTEVEFKFSVDGSKLIELQTVLDTLNLSYSTSGSIVTASKVSADKKLKIYSNLQEAFLDIQLETSSLNSPSALVINKETQDFFYYDSISNTEHFLKPVDVQVKSWINNFITYATLLKLFRTNPELIEFDDQLKRKLLMVDNGKEKNIASINYTEYDIRIFSKDIEFDVQYVQDRINNKEWLSCFKHSVIELITAQLEANRSFIEIFLNIDYIVSNTNRDYDIYISQFSFEKLSREFKTEKQRYFTELNQSQEKIKGQVFAVPLSIGTTIFTFYQLKLEKSTLIFLAITIAFYMAFIIWYLWLYEKDLKKLRLDIANDSNTFRDFYPTIYKLFERDFTFINNKVGLVLKLSNTIKAILIINWVILLIYILFFYKQTLSPGLTPRFI
jgi:hypothetical protein